MNKYIYNEELIRVMDTNSRYGKIDVIFQYLLEK